MNSFGKDGSFRVLHITPHLGGGVGRVLGALFKELGGHGSHVVASLDVANEWASKQIRDAGVPVVCSAYKDIPALIEQVKVADVVVIHWWNHPLLYALLVRWELPPTRILIWSHISGLHAPAEFTSPLLDYPDRFIATTPISRNALAVSNPDRLGVIWATSGLGYAAQLKPQEHAGFVVGYLGTVDYSKLHPLFIDMCIDVSLSNASFEVCGGDAHVEIGASAADHDQEGRIEFFGKVDDISQYLPRWDVFGYPLNPFHFGTCDQALAEAMAAAIPPVVMNNPMECSMVQHMETGLVSTTPKEYVENIGLLHDNVQLSRELGEKAKEYALHAFSVKQMVTQWLNEISLVMETPPVERHWGGKYVGKSCSGYEFFLESNFTNQQLFEQFREGDPDAVKRIEAMGRENPAWRSKNKGTAHQYASFFRDDADLKRLAACMQ